MKCLLSPFCSSNLTLQLLLRYVAARRSPSTTKGSWRFAWVPVAGDRFCGKVFDGNRLLVETSWRVE